MAEKKTELVPVEGAPLVTVPVEVETALYVRNPITNAAFCLRGEMARKVWQDEFEPAGFEIFQSSDALYNAVDGGPDEAFGVGGQDLEQSEYEIREGLTQLDDSEDDPDSEPDSQTFTADF